MKEIAALLMLVFIECSTGLAQAAPVPSSTASFEVATVKRSQPGSTSGTFWSPPGVGKFAATNASLAFLLQMAFGVDDEQIPGKPAWLESDLFDVVAKPDAGIALSREELKPRLQELLEQRFHLKTHRETKLVRGYELVVAKGGPRMTAAASDHWPGFRVRVGPGRMEGLNWSMAYLATMLARPAGLPVEDRTGLTGSYDIKLLYAADIETDSSLPSLFTAVQESLGLKLVTGKVPVRMLVIDSVERAPTEN